MSELELSVVIPAWNKAEQLELVLRALARQTTGKERFEVVLVDDGSEPALAEKLPSLRAPELVVIALPHTGNRALLRNLGARSARGRRLLFMDGDMLATPSLLEEHLRVTDDPRAVSLGFRTNLQPFDRSLLHQGLIDDGLTALARWPAYRDERSFALDHGFATSSRRFAHFQLLYSHNFCISKHAFDDVGGFDEAFGENWGGEDVELGYRLVRAGYDLRLTSKALAYHLPHASNVTANVLSLRRNLALFFARHQHWIVELHRREYQMWFNEYARLIEGVASFGERQADACVRASTLHDLERGSRVLLNGLCLSGPVPAGVEVTRLFPSPLREPAPDHLPLLGTALDVADGYYQRCYINAELGRVNARLLSLILREARRVSREVYVVEAGVPMLAPTVTTERRASFLFTMSNEAFCSTQSGYCELALALSRLGADVGLEFANDPLAQVPRGPRFGAIDADEKRHQLERLFDHGLNLVADEVVAVIDPAVIRWTNRSIGNRVTWLGLELDYQEQALKAHLSGKGQLWLHRKRDAERLGIEHARVVRVGAELDKYGGRVAGPIERCRLLWCHRVASPLTDPLSVVRAFKQAFSLEAAEPAELTLLCGPAEPPALPPDCLVNDVERSNESHRLRRWQLLHEAYLRQLREEIAGDPRIRLEVGPATESRIAGAVLASVIVDASSVAEISPFVLEAACVGRRSIVGSGGCYDEYIEHSDLILVASDACSAADVDPLYAWSAPPEWPQLGRRQISTPALARAMRAVYEEPSSTVLDPDARARYAATLGWDSVASRLLAELEGADDRARR